MQATYTLSRSLIAVNSPATVDLIINFQAPENQKAKYRRPLNLSIVLDRSGSMAGSPLQYAIKAAQKLIDYLTPEDILSIVIYDDHVDTILSPQLVIDPNSIKVLLSRIRVAGCTNLSGGWLMGCNHVKANLSSDRLNRVLLLTDGLANVGQTDQNILIKTAADQAEKGVTTTTLGFGGYFNEDLLIGMANAGQGNFYFIQSPDDAADVFAIEMESLVSVVAQNLMVTLEPAAGIQIESLNSYRFKQNDGKLEIFLGDVYGIESKPLALAVSVPSVSKTGTISLLNLNYQYDTVVNDSMQHLTAALPVTIQIGKKEEASKVQLDRKVIEQTSQFRIAQVKDEAIALADKGDYSQAAKTLRQMTEGLKQKALEEFFSIAEEISQLEYYAQQIENRQYASDIRKEMRDQSYQSSRRAREDLHSRGITSGSANNLEYVETADSGVLVKCERMGGKLRIRVISEGYDSDLNVQFPRSIREEGVTYVVDEVTLAANHSFYRVSGEIRRLGKAPVISQDHSKTTQYQAVKSSLTLADLETTDSVGNGILIQCVQDGKKLRARVVSDGYDPNFNVRFPRGVREEGILFVVDAVKEAGQGGSYIAMGKVKQLVQ
jgi:Ca-activated chloride channel family protein